MTNENSNCIFCKIAKGEIPSVKIWEDEKVLAFLDIQPINPGHILVIPKKHAELVIDLDDETLSCIIKVLKVLNKKVRQSAIKCEGINLFLADGESAGQEVFHVHFHLIPRYKNDGFGFKFPKDYHKKPSTEELNKIAKKIIGK